MKLKNIKETMQGRKDRVAAQMSAGTHYSRIVKNKKKENAKYGCRKGGKKYE
jgi:hypothetical protein